MITKETLEAILNYLGKRPYIEVMPIFEAIQKDLQSSMKAQAPLKKVESK